jgi:LacI family gluconate utilization system Gnt-I transcriptional repressor
MLRPTRRPTLKHVAELSGVSVISASRAMSGAPNVSRDLRSRVQAAADQLGYTPNRIAGSLRAQTTDLIAVVVPSMSNSVFAEVIDGIDEGLSASRYRTVLGISHYDDAREAAILRDMLAWTPAAVIVTGLEHSAAARALLATCARPVLEIMDTDGAPIDLCVGASQREAGRIMARHLVDTGRRRIGYVGAWGERPSRSLKRRLAFEAELEALGAPLAARWIAPEASSIAVGRRGCAEALAAHTDLDALFFANDDLALGALFHCQSAGIAVPGRLALAGFNGLDMAQEISPRLTTIDNPRAEMGRRAAALLLDRLEPGGGARPSLENLPLSLRRGETS